MKKELVIYSNTENAATDIAAENAATVIPVIEESATVGKQLVEAGKVRISKQVRETEQMVDVPLLREEVAVERVPIGQVVEERLPTRYDGDTLIIPVIEEQVFLTKRLVLIEELHVRKQTIETHESQRITLLKEEVEITRIVDDANFGSRNSQ